MGPADASTTRPITDRVKTSLFDRLAAQGRIEGAVVLDMFAGTGSMGLECLSRGAAHATFIERDRDAQKRLRQNIDALGESGGASVLGSDALSAALFPALGGRRFALIFCDPPYAMMLDTGRRVRVEKQVTRLARCAEDDAVLILRTPQHAEITPIEGWGDPESFQYGSMWLSFYRRTTDAPDAESA